MTDTDVTSLVTAARAAREHAHAPYSNFTVGAALLCSSGEIVTGVNVENASYGLSICAERVALARAVSEGHRQFAAIAIVADGSRRLVPCGACCQVLAEFCGADFSLYLANDNDEPQIRRLGELLTSPFVFRTDNQIGG